MADQQINGNAKIIDVDPDDWKQIKCSLKPEGEPDNLYRNFQLLGDSELRLMAAQSH